MAESTSGAKNTKCISVIVPESKDTSSVMGPGKGTEEPASQALTMREGVLVSRENNSFKMNTFSWLCFTEVFSH